jgi:hypothetical protein
MSIIININHYGRDQLRRESTNAKASFQVPISVEINLAITIVITGNQ